MLQVRGFRAEQTEDVVALWAACGLTRTWNDPRKDVARKLAEQPELFLVAEDDGAVVGTAMAGYDGHRGWVHYLAVDPGRRGEGLGRLLMQEVERRLLELGCPKVMLMVRSANRPVVAFYEGLGYAADDVVVLGRRLIPDA